MTRFLSFLCCFFFAFFLNAQPLLDIQIEFKAENEKLESILYRLSEKPSISLAFSNEILPSNHQVSLRKARYSLRAILKHIFRNTGIQYKIVGGQIVLFYEPPPAKHYILSGYVEDEETGERLIGANIYIHDQQIGTTSNAYGFYSIKLKEGNAQLTYSYLGYQKLSTNLDLSNDLSQTIALKPSLTLKEVIITARDSTIPSSSIFSFNLSPEEMDALPAVGGESDILRYASFMPGVQTGADGVGGLHIRGGSVDQNLILLDDVTVYNPSHLIGVFSVFNPSAIKSADLIKGRFPSRYGGRLSSVLDIRTKDGNKKKWVKRVGLGISAVSLSVEGPLVKNKSSLFISARTSPLNFLIKPISRKIKERRNQEGFMSYKFYDANAKFNYSFSNKDKIYLSFYKGGDQFHEEGKINYTINQTLRNEDNSFQNLGWGNTIGSFRWNHVFGNKLFLNTSLTYSHYHFDSEGLFTHSDTLLTDGSTLAQTLITQFSSDIKDRGLKMNFDYLASPNHRLNFGVALIDHAFTPGVAASDLNLVFSIDDFELIDGIFDTLTNPTIKSLEYGIYLEDEWTIGQRLKLNLGLRSAGFYVNDKWYHSIQPRLDISMGIGKRMNIHGSFSYMEQYLHLLTTSGIGLPTDLWVPSTASIKPQNSWQAVFGWGYRSDNNFFINVEGYYKRMNNIIDFLSDSSLDQINSYNWENRITVGQGKAYGVELMLEKKIGRTRGLISYTLAKSVRQFEELNNGEVFPFRYDRRHNINAYFIQKMGRKWDFSASFTYGSGLAISLPTEKFEYFVPSEQLFVPLVGFVFDGKNNIRLSPNHRLDIQFSYRFGGEKTVQGLSFGIYNLYNRKNALYYRPGQNPDNPSEETYLKASLIPIMPYINYSLKF